MATIPPRIIDQDGEWLEKMTEMRRTFYVRDGYGRGHYWGEPRDSQDVIIGHQDTVTVSGTLLGYHPERGAATLSSDAPAVTEVTQTTEMPPVFYEAAER